MIGDVAKSGALVAYKVGDTAGWSLAPASWRRAWMSATPDGFAYRCLPMTIANQAGWVLGCPISFTATWNGSNAPAGSMAFDFGDEQRFQTQIRSCFGSGIITFSIPYLFRTPKGIGLLVRGAPNDPRANAFPLEGFVETDWSCATFTMNWKIERAGEPVKFEKGDPVCFLQPVDLRIAEQLDPLICEVSDNPMVDGEYRAWSDSRAEFNARADRGKEWQRDYYLGRNIEGAEQDHDHITSLKVNTFEDTCSHLIVHVKQNAIG